MNCLCLIFNTTGFNFRKTKIKMEITKELIEQKRNDFPGCKLAIVSLKAENEQDVALEVLVRSPNRQVISEAEKWETSNPGKAKEIYVRNCVLTDTDKVMASDNLFYQAFFAIADLLPFQKPETKIL
nr:MAG TPA: hypothetical protein [Caudoviricetes sp.]